MKTAIGIVLIVLAIICALTTAIADDCGGAMVASTATGAAAVGYQVVYVGPR